MKERFSPSKQVLAFLMKVLVIGAFLLSCKSDPSSKLVKEVKSVLNDVSAYEYGKSRRWLQEYDTVMSKVYNTPEIREPVQHLMLEMLKNDASRDAKLIVCKTLESFGDAESIPVLVDLLNDPATAHMGLMALSTIPDEMVDEELIGMLAQSEGDVLVGIINLLGQRKNVKAIEPLMAFLNHDDPQVRKASIKALGNIGGAEAMSILESSYKTETSEIKWNLADQILTIAKNLDTDQKLAIALDIYHSVAPISVRFKAFYLIFESRNTEEQVDLIASELKSADPDMQEAIIPCIRKIDPNVNLQPLLKEFQLFPLTVQKPLMLAISDRGDQAIRPLAINWLAHESEELRIVALQALKNVCDSRDVIRLAQIAARNSDAERDLARSCLYWMDDPMADQIILEVLDNATGNLKAELIACVGYRKIVDGRDAVFANLNNPNSNIRSQSISTLGKIGKESDFEKLLEWTLTNAQRDDEEMLSSTLTTLALLSDGKEDIIMQLDEKLHESSDEMATCIFLEVLGEMGGEKSFEIIKPFVVGTSDQVQFTALKVLSNWENDLPLNTLKQQIQTEMVPRNHSQTLAGIVYLVQYSHNLDGIQKVNELKKAFDYAATEFDKKMVLRGFSRITNQQALEFVIGYIDDKTVKAEAQDAVIEIAGNLRYSQPEVAKKVVGALLEKELDSEFAERLEILRKSLSL